MISPLMCTALRIYVSYKEHAFPFIYWIRFYDAFGVVLRFVLVEQTKLLDAEFKYLIKHQVLLYTEQKRKYQLSSYSHNLGST